MNKPSLNTLLQNFEAEQIQRKLPDFGPGDTVVVNVKVKEGNRERVQAYEGVVIAKKNARPELRLHRAQDLARLRRRARVPDPQRRSSTRSKSSAAARSAPASCTTCVAWKARRRASRKTWPPTPRPRPPRSLPPPRSSKLPNAMHATAAARRPFAFPGVAAGAQPPDNAACPDNFARMTEHHDRHRPPTRRPPRPLALGRALLQDAQPGQAGDRNRQGRGRRAAREGLARGARRRRDARSRAARNCSRSRCAGSATRAGRRRSRRRLYAESEESRARRAAERATRAAGTRRLSARRKPSPTSARGV